MIVVPQASAKVKASRSLVVGTLVLILFNRIAMADVLVLDACMQQCTESDMTAIKNLREVLQFDLDNPYILASAGAVMDRFGGRAPLPGVEDSSLTSELLEKHLHIGIEKWNNANINDVRENEDAVQSLTRVIDEAMANPLIVYSNPQLRTLIDHAYIGRAICQKRLRRSADAREGIADMVRATPEGSILDSYGTDANKVFQDARADLLERGVGTLTIHVDDPDVVFSFNVNGKPHRGVFAADMMLPGNYQVFMVDGAKRSRRFHLYVPPHGHASLDVVWNRDAAFETPTAQRLRIGFTYASYEERRLEGEYASYFATLVPGALVLVVGRIAWEGKDALVGVVYGPGEAEPHQVGVIVGTDSVAARELATYLLTNNPSPDVIRLAAPPWAKRVPGRADVNAQGWSSTWFIAGGATAVALGAGLYAIDQNPGRHTAPYGLAVGTVGVALAGVGFGIWLRDTSSPGRSSGGPTLSVSGSHAVIGWVAAF